MYIYIYRKAVAINAGHVADKGASEFALRGGYRRHFTSKCRSNGMLKFKIYEDSGETPFYQEG